MPDRDIFLIEVARRGRDGNYTGATEVASLKTRATALEARPNITSLNAVPNVTAPSPTSGQVLAWNGSAWVPTATTTGIPTVRNTSGSVIVSNVTTLRTSSGMALSDFGSGEVEVSAAFGGSGSAATLSRSDHSHTNVVPVRGTFAPQAYMSSGTRTLTSTNVTLASGIGYVVNARLNMQMRGGDPGACYYQLRLTINGNARTSGAGTAGFWCVQGVPDKTTWEHALAITGTGAAITVSADVIYHSGGGFYTDAGEVVVELSANR